MNKIAKISIIVSVIIFVIGITSMIIYKKNLNQPASVNEESVVVEIEGGSGVKDITKILGDNDLLKHPTTFLIYLRLNNLTSELEAGTYTFKKNMNILEITGILTGGKVTTKKVTIPEGWTITKMADRFEAENVVSKTDFLVATKKEYDYDFLDSKPDDQDLEGYLFPDTYFFKANPSGEEVVRAMLDNFGKKLSQDLKGEIEKQGKSIHDVITMASIVEREVITEEDRAIVAGLLYKRIDYNMRLEVDSTINYITGKKDASATAEDLNIVSPYNTYRNKGLPPGPIASPSLSAISATIYPESSPYLYYLSRQDTKETIFSRTFDEHVNNKNKYLK